MRYSFGDYVLDTQRYELQRDREPLKLRSKVFAEATLAQVG